MRPMMRTCWEAGEDYQGDRQCGPFPGCPEIQRRSTTDLHGRFNASSRTSCRSIFRPREKVQPQQDKP